MKPGKIGCLLKIHTRLEIEKWWLPIKEGTWTLFL